MPAAQQALPRPGGPKRPDAAARGRLRGPCVPMFRQAAVLTFFRRFPANVLKGVRQRVRPAVPVMYQRSRGRAAAFMNRIRPSGRSPRAAPCSFFPHRATQKNRAPSCPNETTKKKPAVSCMAAPAERWNIARRKANERHCERPNAPLRAALPYGSSGGRQRPNCFGRIGFICSMQPWPWQKITYTSFVVYIIRPFSGDCQSVLPAYVPPKPHARTKLFPRGLLCIASGAKARYNRGTLHSRSGVLGPCAPLRPVFRQVRVPQFQRKDLLS